MTPTAEAPLVKYLDDHILVVDKPAGLLCVPGRGADKADCLHARLLKAYPELLVVHRLDMATSGLVLFARNFAVQRLLGLAFQDRRVAKRYVAIVHGIVDVHRHDAVDPRETPVQSGWHTISLPIGADWHDRPRRKVDTESGKPSCTRFRVARYLPDGTTRLDLEPVTGRTHQLRVHLDAIGHPIVGDALYGPPGDATRLSLHAASLRLSHPVTGNLLTVDTEPGELPF